MNSCWRFGDSPGRGEGVFATRTIGAGEEVGFAKICIVQKLILVVLLYSVKKVATGADRKTLADVPKCEACHCQRWDCATAGRAKVGSGQARMEVK